MTELTPEEAREVGRKVAEAWRVQREAVVAFLEGLNQGLANAGEEE